MNTVSLISLGCPRNLVDSETMLGLLKEKGFRITEDFSRCDAAVLNTCSFIEDAKRESIDLILQLAQLKRENRLKTIIVTGCLPQRYPAELKNELKEVDAFVGTGDFAKIADVVKKTLNGKRISEISKRPSFLADHSYPRVLITPRHFIYLKVSEGCAHKCSYCIIPRIRGRLRSRSMDSLLAEVRGISKKQRISELNLIGQDITLYGADLYKAPMLAELLKKLAGLKAARPVRHCRTNRSEDEVSNGARWLRLLYTHPEHYTDELIDTIKNERAICKYVDLPLQHINDRILGLMNRGTTKKGLISLITRLRKEIPNLAIRTTFIVGFPSESDNEFKELFGFVKEMQFERLGVFEYSREDETRAYNLKGQIPDNVKKERFEAIMKLQQEISKEVNAKFLGKELEVLIDETNSSDVILSEAKDLKHPPHSGEPIQLLPLPFGERAGVRGDVHNYIGRTEYDAPEVDGNCFVRTNRPHKPGDFVKVKIVDTLEYDLVGEEV